MDLPDRLYRLRKERGLSQEELAHSLGVSRQAVQKWESGASRPDLDNLTALAQCLQVSLDYLILGKEDTPPQEESPAAYAPFWAWRYEYKSKATLFGLPLVHINVGHYGLYWARGVIAVGNLATGVLSLGGFSAGLLSAGGMSVGGLALGGLCAGLAALGGLAVGALCAIGGLALSLGLAVGGGAVSAAWAIGGGAMAGQIAMGGAASAPIAIGEATTGAVTFPKDTWGPGTGQAIRAAIQAMFPHTPGFLVALFSQFL